MKTALHRVALVGVAVVISGCSAGAQSPVSTNGDCPATIDLQSWWTPQADNGYLYQGLLREAGKPITYEVDAKHARVTGPLYDEGKPTGLRLRIRAGGPILHYASTPSLMATDHSILIGQVATLEDQIAAYGLGGRMDTVTVFAPLESDPRAIMWDEQQHPEIHSISDVGNSGIPVYTLLGSMSTDHLVANGTLKVGQPDTSNGNSPDMFLTHRGSATTGYVTNELDLFRSKGVKVGFDMLANAFPTYSDLLIVRAQTFKDNAPCLRRVIPILQRNLRQFVASPEPAVRMVSDLAKQYTGEDYPVSRGMSAVTTARNLGVLGNGPNRVLGATNPTRINDVLNKVLTVLASQHRPLPDGLTAARLATTEFLDGSVSMGSA